MPCCCSLRESAMEFCDLACKYATFPKSDAVDGSRSCRAFVALRCMLRKKLVHKSLPCRDNVIRKRQQQSVIILHDSPP